jgi:cellulose 1,4-beta-cellobiosidase
MPAVNMRALMALVPHLGAANALPQASTSTPSATATSSGPAVTASGNPFEGYQLYANPYYSSEVISLAVPSMTGSLAEQATHAAEIPSFHWM